MLSLFTLAVLIGMQHALEADHLAAVASIASRHTSVARIIRSGAVWGLGHTITLMLFAGIAVVAGVAFDAVLTGWLEFAVGLMLIVLGGHLIFRLVRDRIHFHFHRHGDGLIHFHAHSHAADKEDHRQSEHAHDHPRRFPLRPLLIGMMHGMAGSAALLVLTASAAPSPGVGAVYVLLFGTGSIIGMAALSAIIAVPISYSARFLTWANRGIQGSVGVATFALGLIIAFDKGREILF